MADYKSKPARIVDKIRKIWKKPGAPSSGTFTAGASPAAKSSQVGSAPYKKKPKRKGRPD